MVNRLLISEEKSFLLKDLDTYIYKLYGLTKDEIDQVSKD